MIAPKVFLQVLKTRVRALLARLVNESQGAHYLSARTRTSLALDLKSLRRLLASLRMHTELPSKASDPAIKLAARKRKFGHE